MNAAVAAKDAAATSAAVAATQAAAAKTAQETADAASAAATAAEARAKSSASDAAARSAADALADQSKQAAAAAATAKMVAASAAKVAAQDADLAAKAAQGAAHDASSNVRADLSSAGAACDPQLLLNKGITVINNRCERFFERLGKASQGFDFGVKEWGLLGGTAGAIEGLTGVAAKQVAITAAGFGFGTASAGVYQSAYLFSADVGSVQSMVTSQQKSARDTITTTIQQQGGFTSLTRDDVLQVLKQYERSCEVQTIHNLVDQSVKTAKPDVNKAPEIASVTPPPFVIGQKGSFTVTATGTPAPTLTKGTCPEWVQIEADTGIVSGTPPAPAGPQPCAINAKNGVQPDASKTLTLQVTQGGGGSPAFTSVDTVRAVVGVLFNQTVTTNPPATSFKLQSGPCFSWMSLNPTSGSLTGTPKTSNVGTYTCDVVANNSNTQTLKVTVTQPQPLHLELNYSVR